MKAKFLFTLVIVVCTIVNVYWSVRNQNLRKEIEELRTPYAIFNWEIPSQSIKPKHGDSFKFPPLPVLPEIQKCPPEDNTKIEV